MNTYRSRSNTLVNGVIDQGLIYNVQRVGKWDLAYEVATKERGHVVFAG